MKPPLLFFTEKGFIFLILIIESPRMFHVEHALWKVYYLEILQSDISSESKSLNLLEIGGLEFK